MRNYLRFVSWLLLAVASLFSLSSCAMISRNAKVMADDFKDLTGLGEDEKEKAGQPTKKPNVNPQLPSAPSELYGEEEIIWVDEDPTVAMPGLDELWKRGPRDEWHRSHAEAMREARKLGRPVLVWFTDSDRNPTSQALDTELFSTEKFNTWASDKVVLLQIDRNVVDSNQKRLSKKREYVEKMRKRYKILGNPVVVILSPRGTQHAKYRGYRSGDADFYLGKLKSGYRNAQLDYGRWREEYEAKGYRVWHDNRGRKVFAKPKAYKDGILYLVEPDGKKSRTSLSKLSQEDRDWVLEKVKAKQ